MFIWHQNLCKYTEAQLLHKNAMGNLTSYLFLSLIIAKIERTQTTWNNRNSQAQWDNNMMQNLRGGYTIFEDTIIENDSRSKVLTV